MNQQDSPFTSGSHIMFQRPVCPFICPPTPTPKALERGGVVLGHTPTPAVPSPLPGSACWPSHTFPLPRGCSKGNTLLRVYSSSVRVASQHLGIPGCQPPTQPAAAPDKTGQRRTLEPGTPWAALPSLCPPHPQFTAVGTEARRRRASPWSQPLPAGQGCLPGLASRGPRGAHAPPSPC